MPFVLHSRFVGKDFGKGPAKMVSLCPIYLAPYLGRTQSIFTHTSGPRGTQLRLRVLSSQHGGFGDCPCSHGQALLSTEPGGSRSAYLILEIME